MFYDETDAEEREDITDTGLEEPENPLSSGVLSTQLSQVVASWTLSPEQRQEYIDKVYPILRLLAFDEALGSTALPNLPPIVRIIGGFGVMLGVAVIMRKGKKGGKERGKERSHSGGTGVREERGNRGVRQESTKARGSGGRINVSRPDDLEGKKDTDILRRSSNVNQAAEEAKAKASPLSDRNGSNE